MEAALRPRAGRGAARPLAQATVSLSKAETFEEFVRGLIPIRPKKPSASKPKKPESPEDGPKKTASPNPPS